VRAFVAVAALSVASSAVAQTQSGDPPAIPGAVRLAAESRVTLDGSIGEPAWLAVPAITDLRQYDPAVGMLATERTHVRVLYDTRTLYVSVVAVDAAPRELIARILTRDRVMLRDQFGGGLTFAGDDGVAILLDPFRDRRNAVVFATNPNGAEFEAQVTDQGREVNVAWRTVWRVAATRHDSGWSAEFEIPLRSIRHPDDGRAWGFNVYRVIRRKNEHAMWRSWSRDNAGFLKVSEAGDLPGIHSLAREGLGVEVKTSAIGRAVHGDVDGRSTPADGALDLKYELRPGVTMDATVNTDFAQADVDDVQINLTRFDLFFPEKRDFFLENSGVFEFGATSFFEPPPWLMFFSRRIGIADAGEIPVLGGVRLTGREGRQTFGAMHMQTAQALDQSRASYSTARFKRDVGGGYVGAMFAGKAYRTPDPLVDPLPTTGRIPTVAQLAQSYGLDAQYWLAPTTSAQAFVAQVQGGDAVGASERDRMAYKILTEHNVERWGLRLEHIRVGEFADPPMGFATRTDISRGDLMMRLTFTPKAAGLRRFQIFQFGQYVARTDGGLQDWAVGPGLDFTWESGDNVVVYRQQSVTVLDETFDLADRVLVDTGHFENAQSGLFFTSAPHRPVSVNVQAQHQSFYGGRLFFVNGTVNVAIGARGTIALTRVFNDARVPNGRLITNVSAVRLGYAVSTRAAFSSTVQYDALDQRLNTNARFSFLYRPGSELFLVVNSEREPTVLSADQPRTALLKLTYLARF